MPPAPEALRIEAFARLHRPAAATPALPTLRGLNVVEAKGDYRYPPHQHTDFEIILVDRGPYLCLLNRVRLAMEGGAVLVVKPGDWHEDFCAPPLRYLTVQFSLEGAGGRRSAPPLLLDAAPEEQYFADADAQLLPLVEQMQREARVGDAVAPRLQEALFLEFFWRLVRALPRRLVSAEFLARTAEAGFAAELERLFRRRQSENVSVPEMAGAMHLSDSAFAHKCKKLLGVSPAKAFLRYRMGRAATLLRETGMSVKEIAAYLGFDDPYHFSKAFKRTLGRSPSDFRA